MPRIIKQRALINCMLELNYDVDIEGVCFGLSSMAEQALLSGEFDKFLKRIDEITTHEGMFKSYFDRLAIKEQLDKKMEGTLEGKASDEVMKFQEELQLLQENLEKRNDILAFFDGILFYMSPEKIINKWGKEKWHKEGSQSEIDLGAYNQHDRPFQKLVTPVKLDREIKEITNIFLATMRYSKKQFEESLGSIITNFGEQAFALTLSTENHAICILHDPLTKPPILMSFDPNHMPSELSEAQNLDIIAADIGTSFSDDNPIFTIELHSTDATATQLAAIKLKKDDKWQALHQINDTNFDERFKLAYLHGDDTTCNEVLNYLRLKNAHIAAFKKSEFYAYLYKQGIKNNLARKEDTYTLTLKHMGYNRSEIEDSQILATVKINGEALGRASIEKRSDPEVILAAYEQNPISIIYANKDSVIELLSTGRMTLESAPEHIKNDTSFVMAAYKHDHGSLRYISLKIMVALLKTGDLSLEHVPESIKDKREAILAAYEKDPTSLKYAGKQILGDLLKEGLVSAQYAEGAISDLDSSEDVTKASIFMR